MIFIKINENLYPAIIDGKMNDRDWDNRESKEITMEMDYGTASTLFIDGTAWSIIQREDIITQEPVYKTDDNGELVLDENGNSIVIDVNSTSKTVDTEWDNSEYCIVGDITIHRNNTITIKMGKLTQLEKAYVMLLGGDL